MTETGKPIFSNSTLYCFYDLLYSPITFDFIQFLVFAEIIRKHHQYENISVVIFTGEDYLFRKRTEKDVVLDDHEKLWRLRHVIAPTCWSLPSCQGVWITHNREDVRTFHASLHEKQVFPLNYSPETPKVAFTVRQLVALHNAGADLNVFRAPLVAKRKVEEWVKTNNIEKPILALSLRNDHLHQWKNSELNQWVMFEDYLLKQNIQPVVIPDTFLALRGLFPKISPGAKLFFQGSLDFELRAALYEKAFATVSSHGGPAMYNLFRSDSRCLIFQGDTANPSESEFHRMWGVKWGEQPPWTTRLQRIVYQNDDFGNLVKNFEKLLDASSDDLK